MFLPRWPGSRFLPLVSLLCALGCADSPAAPTGSTGTAGAGGAGGGGGSGGAEPLPPLDPQACPVTEKSGEDPALAAAAEAQHSADFVFPESASILQDKAFPLASFLAADPALLADIAADPALSAIGADRDDRMRAAAADCAHDVICVTDALLWTDEEAAAAAAALTTLLSQTGKLAPFAAALRASGRFGLHALQDDAALSDIAFRDLATSLNATLGKQAGSLGGPALQGAVAELAAAHPEPLLFFEPLLLVALAALAADGRDEAARYEPLAEGENAAAAAHIPTIDWDAFPFTLILVPGKGPSSLDIALDPTGKARCDLAAQRFQAKLAPLVALSGGHVHPDRTPYSEAIEMKKYLLDTHGIPEEALLVDPHARHTTTNLRNVSRLLFRHGVPTDRALLVTSDFGQSIYIGYWGGMFGPRCEEELGYLPWRSLVPISQNDSCMVPVAVSLHADGKDPLDP